MQDKKRFQSAFNATTRPFTSSRPCSRPSGAIFASLEKKFQRGRKRASQGAQTARSARNHTRSWPPTSRLPPPASRLPASGARAPARLPYTNAPRDLSADNHKLSRRGLRGAITTSYHTICKGIGSHSLTARAARVYRGPCRDLGGLALPPTTHFRVSGWSGYHLDSATL